MVTVVFTHIHRAMKLVNMNKVAISVRRHVKGALFSFKKAARICNQWNVQSSLIDHFVAVLVPDGLGFWRNLDYTTPPWV